MQACYLQGIEVQSGLVKVDGVMCSWLTGLMTRQSQEGSLWLNGLVLGGIPGGPQPALMRGVSEEMRVLQVCVLTLVAVVAGFMENLVEFAN